MQGTEGASQFEMGMSSMVSLLTNISQQTDEGLSFLDKINGKVTELIDFSVTPFGNITQATVNFQKIISENSNKSLKLLENIDRVLENLYKKNVDPALNVNVDVNSSKPKPNGNSFSGSLITNNIGKQNQFIFNGFKVPNIKFFDKMFDTLMKFVEIDKKKFDSAISFLDSLGEKLEKMEKTAKVFAISFVSVIGSLLLLNFLEYDSVIKFAIVVGILGIAMEILNKRISTADKEKFGELMSNIGIGMRNLGIGLALLTLSLIAFEYVKFGNVMMLLTFVGGLGLIFKMFKFDRSISPMLTFSYSIGMLTLSMIALSFVEWNGIFKLLTFIGGLGLIFKMFKFDRPISPMLVFSYSIGMLTLSMIALSFVEWNGIFKLLTFIGGLGLIFKLFRFDRPISPMLTFSYSISILTLAMFAMGELPWESIGKMLLFVGTLGLIFKVFGFSRPISPLVPFALGIGILVLAMYAMDELPWESIFKTLLFISGLGLALKFMKPTSIWTLLGVSAAIVALAYALKIYKSIGFEIKDALIFAGSIALIGAIMVGLGVPIVAGLIGLGLVVALGMAGTSVLVALALQQIGKVNTPLNKIQEFVASVGSLAWGYFKITPLLVLASASAILFLPLGASALLGALALYAISKVKINKDQVIAFTDSLGIVASGFRENLNLMIPATIASLAFLPIAAAGLIGAGLLKLISLINVDVSMIDIFILGISKLATGFSDNALLMLPAAVAALAFLPVATSAYLGVLLLEKIASVNYDMNKIDQYNIGISKIVEGTEQFGLISLAKTSLKSLALLPIFGSAYLGALALQKIASVNIDKDKMQAFGDTMSFMVDTILMSLAGNEDKLEKAKPGIEALAKLMGTGKGLAEVIQMMANLKFYEYAVKDGKLVLTGSRQLTSNDFKMVGENLGLMLQTLINPLEVLGSDSDTIKIGSYTFANPFRSNKTKNAIEMLGALGSAYRPMAESIKSLAESGVMTDPELTKRFTNSLLEITAVYIWIFDKLQKFDTNLVGGSISKLIEFNDTIKNLETKEVSDLNQIFEKFITNLSDEIKWKRIRDNVTYIRKEFGEISKNINAINIEKATLFEKNIRNLIEKNNGVGLKDAVESLRELIGMVEERQYGSFGSTYQTPIQTPVQQIVQTQNTPSTASKIDTDAITQLTDVMNQILTAITGVDTKLGNKLKVQIVGNTPFNQI